jgi:hypothetical protein
MKTTSELRKNLAECFMLARDGKLSGDALRGVIGCANQINTSIAVETKARAQAMREGAMTKAFGDMEL